MQYKGVTYWRLPFFIFLGGDGIMRVVLSIILILALTMPAFASNLVNADFVSKMSKKSNEFKEYYNILENDWAKLTPKCNSDELISFINTIKNWEKRSTENYNKRLYDEIIEDTKHITVIVHTYSIYKNTGTLPLIEKSRKDKNEHYYGLASNDPLCVVPTIDIFYQLSGIKSIDKAHEKYARGEIQDVLNNTKERAQLEDTTNSMIFNKSADKFPLIYIQEVSSVFYKNKGTVSFTKSSRKDIPGGIRGREHKTLFVLDVRSANRIVNISSLFENEELALHIITNEMLKKIMNHPEYHENIKRLEDLSVYDKIFGHEDTVNYLNPTNETYEDYWALYKDGIVIRFSNVSLTRLAFPTDVFEIPLEKLQKAKPKKEYWAE